MLGENLMKGVWFGKPLLPSPSCPPGAKACVQEKVAQRAVEKGVLLVRVRDLPSSGGLLSERQKRWLDTAPYDCSTENPVLYKLVTYRRSGDFRL